MSVRLKALALALAVLLAGCETKAVSLRLRQRHASGTAAATGLEDAADATGTLENPRKYPVSLDRIYGPSSDDKGMTGSSDFTGSTGTTGSTGSAGSTGYEYVFDKRSALGSGNSHWDWVHESHGGSAGVRNDLIHARNKGKHYFDIMRSSLLSGQSTETGAEEEHSSTGIWATGGSGATAPETETSLDAAMGGAETGGVDDKEDDLISEATGGANDGFAKDDQATEGGSTGGATAGLDMSLTGAAAVEAGRLAMTGGAPAAQSDKTEAMKSWSEREADSAEEEKIAGTSSTCVLAVDRKNARTLTPEAKWCHSFNSMPAACAKMYVTKPSKGTALCSYDKDNDTCNRGPWSKCKGKSIAASRVADSESKGDTSAAAAVAAAASEAALEANSLLDPRSDTAGRPPKSLSSVNEKKARNFEQSPEDVLDEMETAMDNLSREPSIGISQRNETGSLKSNAADEQQTFSSKNATNLDPDLRRAFADARAAEADFDDSAPEVPSSFDKHGSLSTDDLVSANSKHWTEAGNMGELPANWEKLGF